MLVPAVRRIKALFGRAPRAVTADRGYGEASVEPALADLGVKKIAIPRKGKPGQARRAVEPARGFRSLIKWRTGPEGRISHLKHSWGFDRTLLDGIAGATTWCGWGSARSQHSQGRRSQPGKKRSTDPGPPKATSFKTDRHRPADRSVTDAPLYCLNPVLVPVGFTRCAPPLKTAEA
jgi:IS5 family transposase